MYKLNRPCNRYKMFEPLFPRQKDQVQTLENSKTEIPPTE